MDTLVNKESGRRIQQQSQQTTKQRIYLPSSSPSKDCSTLFQRDSRQQSPEIVNCCKTPRPQWQTSIRCRPLWEFLVMTGRTSACPDTQDLHSNITLRVLHCIVGWNILSKGRQTYHWCLDKVPVSLFSSVFCSRRRPPSSGCSESEKRLVGFWKS